MNEGKKEEPTWSKETGWTCPPGYAHPKCPECGHNFFESRPLKKVKGKAPSGGLCQWCIEDISRS